MVPLWFTLSALCFVGAGVLLYVDIDKRRGLGRRRKSWARSHGFDYERESGEIVQRWKRGVMSTVGDVTALCMSAEPESPSVAAAFIVHEISDASVGQVAAAGFLARLRGES